MRAGLPGLLALLGALGSYGGEARLDHITGNGRITVALDGEGALRQFYWPGVGSRQHLDENGARWFVATPDGPVSFDTSHWSIEQGYAALDSLVLNTRYTEIGGGRRAEQFVAAIPGKDLLLVRLRLWGFAADTRFFWSQSFLPDDRQLTGFASVPSVLRATSRPVSRFDRSSGLMVHATADPIALRAVDRQSNSGLYAGTVSTNDVIAGGLCADSAEWAAWKIGMPLPGALQAGGRVLGILELVPQVLDDALELNILIGASNSLTGLQTVTAAGMELGSQELVRAASGLGADWYNAIGTGATRDEASARATLNLLLCIDPERGAVMRAPALPDSAVYGDIVDTAWATAALAALGNNEMARTALTHHVNSIRLQSGRDTPAGSLPRRIYRTGEAASVSANADAESAAWLLAACWRQVAVLPKAERSSFLEPLWPALETCTDYLAREPRVGAALSGALPAVSTPLETLRTHYLGLESSRRMAETLNHPEPELWSDRRSELYARIRFRKLNQNGPSEATWPWIDWWIDTLPGARRDAETGWEVLKREDAPTFSTASISAYVDEAGLGPYAPLARRDAMVCLIEMLPEPENHDPSAMAP